MSLAMGIGVSSAADVRAAGEEAANQMLTQLDGRRVNAVIVFASIRFADPRMLKAVRAATGGAPLIGCTDAGSIVTSGSKRRSVAVIGLAVENGGVEVGVERGLSIRANTAGKNLAQALRKRAPHEPRCMLVFPDGLSANGSDVLAGLKRGIAPGVALVGAMAADDLYFQKTFQFHNDEILTDSLPGALIWGDVNVGVGVRHGWVPVGRPRSVTRSVGHIVYQLDDRPAVSIYEDFLGLHQDELMQDPLAEVTLTYPLGTKDPGQSEYMLRDAFRVGRAGSLICTGDIQQGCDVRLMIGGFESALEAAQQAACDARDQLAGHRLAGALVFCSVARQKMLGSEFQGEIDVIRDALGGAGVRLGGFYSYGELAPVAPATTAKRRAGRQPHRAVAQFHNESVVVAALG